MPINRRKFLRLPAIAGLGFAGSTQAQAQIITPAEGEGPFYPVIAQADQDFDLTQIDGNSGTAKGEAIFIEGRVLETNGSPVPNATLDMWQANTHGRYRHPFDQSEQPLDDNFQGWAIIQSGSEGQFRFKTIMPGTYAVGQGWTRPPHLHFKISKTGYLELTTQMYFEGMPLNDEDLLIKRHTQEQQNAMIAKVTDNNSSSETIYQYDIVLEKI